MRPIVMTDRLKALGRMQGEAGAAFLANPTPLTRAAYFRAIRLGIEEAFRGQPAAIRHLLKVSRHILDAMEAGLAGAPSETEDAA